MKRKVVFLLGFLTLLISLDVFSQVQMDGKKRYQYIKGSKNFDNIVKPEGFFTQLEQISGTSPAEFVKKNKGYSLKKASQVLLGAEKVPLTDFILWNELSTGSKPLVRAVVLQPNAEVIVDSAGVPQFLATCRVKSGGEWKDRPNRLKPLTEEEAKKFEVEFFKKPTQPTPTPRPENKVDDDYGQEPAQFAGEEGRDSKSLDKEVREIIGGGQSSIAELLYYDDIKKKMELSDLVHKNKVIQLEGANRVAYAEYSAQERVLNQQGVQGINLSHVGLIDRRQTQAVDNRQQNDEAWRQQQWVMYQQQLAEEKRARRNQNIWAGIGTVAQVGASVAGLAIQSSLLRNVSQPYGYPSGYRYGGGYQPGGITNIINNTNTNSNSVGNRSSLAVRRNYSGGGRPTGRPIPGRPPYQGPWNPPGNPWTPPGPGYDRGLPLMNGPTNYDRNWQQGPIVNGQPTMWTPYDSRVLRSTDGTPIATSGPNPAAASWNPANYYNTDGVVMVSGSNSTSTGNWVPYDVINPTTNTYYTQPGANNTPLPAVWSGQTGSNTGTYTTTYTQPATTNTGGGTYVPTNTGGNSGGGLNYGGW